jgi:hypothetical protein
MVGLESRVAVGLESNGRPGEHREDRRISAMSALFLAEKEGVAVKGGVVEPVGVCQGSWSTDGSDLVRFSLDILEAFPYVF